MMHPVTDDEGLQWPVISKVNMIEDSGLTNKFNFVLRPEGEGFSIQYDDKKLVALNENPIDQGSNSFLQWVDINHINYHKDICSVWRLQPY